MATVVDKENAVSFFLNIWYTQFFYQYHISICSYDWVISIENAPFKSIEILIIGWILKSECITGLSAVRRCRLSCHSKNKRAPVTRCRAECTSFMRRLLYPGKRRRSLLSHGGQAWCIDSYLLSQTRCRFLFLCNYIYKGHTFSFHLCAANTNFLTKLPKLSWNLSHRFVNIPIHFHLKILCVMKTC